MNTRKNIDYSAMFADLDAAVTADFSQVQLYCELGRIVCGRSEKGAAVAAAKYLSEQYPNVPGFSPRNLRRMRDFYRMYGENEELLKLAAEISWTQNVVILEADLNMEERCWYLLAAKQYGWSKSALQNAIQECAHQELTLDDFEVPCYTDHEENQLESSENDQDTFSLSWEYLQKPDGKILFLCHGNICRSPMAEFVMKDMVKKAGLAQEFQIESAATSTEEIGNPVYPPARRKLAEYDLLIGMDRANIRSMYQICGGDFADKMHLLMDFTSRPGEVADPWYTGDFDATWQDVMEGCQGLLDDLLKKRGVI